MVFRSRLLGEIPTSSKLQALFKYSHVEYLLFRIMQRGTHVEAIQMVI